MVGKIKWILGLLMVFFLVLITNLMDQRNFQLLQNSIEIIYQKQLMGKNILFELSTLVHEKAIANALSDSSFYANRNATVNAEIDRLFTEFEENDLLYLERRTFSACNEKLDQILVYEKERLDNPREFFESNRMADLALELEEISKDLASLSMTQLSGGRNQMMIGAKAMSSIEMFTKIENIFLIIIAILIQVLILYNPKPKPVEE